MSEILIDEHIPDKNNLKLFTSAFNKIFEGEKGKGIDDFNGHFWVELEDGTIVDDYDWEHEINDFRHYYRIEKNNKLEYDRCDNELTNKVIIGMLHKDLTKGGLSLDTAYMLFGKLWTPQLHNCMYNSVANQYNYRNKNAKIVFGCVYMKSDDNKWKHYICGGENFQTFYDFKKD